VLTFAVEDGKRISVGLLVNVGQSEQIFVYSVWQSHVLQVYFVKEMGRKEVDSSAKFELRGGGTEQIWWETR